MPLWWHKAAFEPARYEPSAEDFPNPERGWYCMLRFDPAEKQPSDYRKKLTGNPDFLVQLEINLRAYAEKTLDAKAISRMDNVFAALKDAGKRAILRFTYDWNGECWKTEPKDVARILGHMNDLSSLLQARKDDIYCIQGLFVGNWAEMHGSVHLIESEVRLLADTLKSVVDPGTPISVRTPAFFRMCTRSILPGSSGEYAGRLGIYNDALMSSPDDMGSYAAGSVVRGLRGKWSREDELSFQKIACAGAPCGGETAAMHELNRPGHFLREMDELHVSYLNREYHPDVIDSWRKTMVQENGSFHAKPYITAIGAHMGYRFFVRNAALSKEREQGNAQRLNVTVTNLGAAAMYYPKEATLALYPCAGGEAVWERAFDTDVRQWLPGQDSVLSMIIERKEQPWAWYDAYLAVRSPRGEMVRMANAQGYDAARGQKIGRLRIGV